MTDSGSARLVLPRGAAIAAAVFGVAMIALLTTQIVLLEDQRKTVRTQRDDDLLDADVGQATRSVGRIANVTGDLQAALRETRERDLLRRAADASDAVPEIERMQREALRLQRRSIAILQESLAIQRRTEQHAASLDRKTGPTAPPAPLP